MAEDERIALLHDGGVNNRIDSQRSFGDSLGDVRHSIANSICGKSLCCYQPGFSHPQTEFRSTAKRNVSLLLMLLCQLCYWSVGTAICFWFPRVVDPRYV